MKLAGEITGPSNLPSYEMIERENEAALISEALSENPDLAEGSSPYALLTFDSSSKYANIARSLEGKVFNEYFENDPDLMEEEYRQYEAGSTFFLLVNRQELEPAGVMRIIHHTDSGFKSTNDLSTNKCLKKDGTRATDFETADKIVELIGADDKKILDVATIAANPKYGEKATGSPIVLASLIRAVYKYSLQNDYDDLVAIIDAVPLQKLEAVGLPISKPEGIAENFTYLGAQDNTFMHIKIADVERSVSAVDPRLFDYIFGEGALLGESVLSFYRQ